MSRALKTGAVLLIIFIWFDQVHWCIFFFTCAVDKKKKNTHEEKQEKRKRAEFFPSSGSPLARAL